MRERRETGAREGREENELQLLRERERAMTIKLAKED